MIKQALTYDSRDMRYHGVQSDGTAIQIDADAFQDAARQRLTDEQLTNGRADYDHAWGETADPDGWSEDMAGWIPASE